MKRSLTLILFTLTLGLASQSQAQQRLPLPRIVPPPRPVRPVRPPTIHEFARTFRPLPGKYDVVLCHPYTGQPVRVCFTLPPGCVKVVVRKKLFCYEIDFEYRDCEIEINFKRRGRVKVHY